MKIDFKKEIAGYAARCGRFQVVTVPPLQFLMIDGHGDPNTSPAYQDALATLYPVAYALKVFSKITLGRDHSVMPLEGLWWSESMASFTTDRDKSRWDWTMMIMVPDWITDEYYEQAKKTVARKGGAPRLEDLRLEQFDEGLSVQTLHVGSFDSEAPVLEQLHGHVIPEQGLRMTGRHHEIYLSDARRTAADRLRTILRQPVGTGS